MLEPNTDPAAAQPLPLFRAEVLASQQQKFYGEILLIRPFSTSFLITLGLALGAVVLGVLLLGHYTETVPPSTGHPPSAVAKDVKGR
jgi:hypothetical protein